MRNIFSVAHADQSPPLLRVRMIRPCAPPLCRTLLGFARLNPTLPFGIIIDTVSNMKEINEIIAAARSNPADVTFADLSQVRDHLFGAPRQQGTSHRVY